MKTNTWRNSLHPLVFVSFRSRRGVSSFELKLEHLKFEPPKFIIDFSHAVASKRVAGASQSTSQRQCQEVLC